MSTNVRGIPAPVSRRAIVGGLAWATPAVVLASAVPAYAASPGLYLRDGLFVTVADMHYAQGNVSSFVGLGKVPASSSTTGDFNWPNPATGTQTANGEGPYTPGGVAGTPARYGGTGLWLSAPTDAAGTFVAGGVTTVAAGLTMQLAITATFPTGTTPYAPTLGGQAWTVGAAYNRTTLNNTSSNTNLEMQSEPAYSLTPQTSSVAGNTWMPRPRRSPVSGLRSR